VNPVPFGNQKGLLSRHDRHDTPCDEQGTDDNRNEYPPKILRMAPMYHFYGACERIPGALCEKKAPGPVHQGRGSISMSRYAALSIIFNARTLRTLKRCLVLPGKIWILSVTTRNISFFKTGCAFVSGSVKNRPLALYLSSLEW
jgi:hypothetical protein